ncbi:MAG: thioredoxin family protein, partial [Candidatus Eisenbacteria sp.]|nr:thioredoxin family protein [Candidatus Eisenbacteria bacterium]
MRTPEEMKGLGRSATVAVVCGLTLFLAACTVTPGLTTARAEGVEWSNLSLDAALAGAEKTNCLVMIDVYSDHCGQCKVMDDDLWNTPKGAELADGLIALRIASDKPEGIPLQRRYPIMGLPVVLFLRADGSEIDRIVGYRRASDFLEEAHAVKAEIDPLPEMEADLKANPNSLQLRLDVLEKYLYRKRETEAEALFQRLLELDLGSNPRHAAKGLMFLAKYYAYFRQDAEKSQSLWRTLVEQMPNASAITSGVMETYKYANARGQLEQWREW